MDLTGHRVLVTGGSAGIGLELARAFVARGNRVAVCGRSEKKLAAARAELGEVETLPCDLALPESAAVLAADAAGRLGGISILVNNAGMQRNYSFVGTDTEQMLADTAREIQVNLTSLISLTAACVPMLRECRSAAVINVSSALAITPKAGSPVYCATKAAVHSFSLALRYQFEDALPNVRVYEVVPPMVDTDMTRGRGTDKLPPQRVAFETLRGMERDQYEIRIGKAKHLGILHRLSPSAAARIVRNG